MICPYCDSRVKDLPDNHACPHCGAPLGKYCDTEQKKEDSLWQQSLEPLIGIYKHGMGYMEIMQHSVTFRLKFWCRDEIVTTIPYDEIAAVYIKPSGGIEPGFLSVRDRENLDVPLVKTAFQAGEDPTSLRFTRSENEKYTKIYQFFKQCADRNNKAKGA